MNISTDTYKKLKENSVQGRYVVNEQLIDFLDGKEGHFQVETLGFSVRNLPIKSITIGSGKNKVLMWSQMHGNESTTTKAVLDLINFLESDTNAASTIVQNCTIKILPILNPDGAYAYTRFNANKIDLNRDARVRSQPESKILRDTYTSFKPDFCFNLHDQRTIYNVGTSSKPATISFLAPAYDEERTISETRKVSMQLIVAMNEVLQKVIPGQVGRYDDAFNENCVGDTFQMLNTPTILFEAGHFPLDYQREKTREYIFYSLVEVLEVISGSGIENFVHEAYFDIPENGKLFYDVLIKNVLDGKNDNKKDIGILFTEVLEGGKITFISQIEKTGNLDGFFGHKTYDYQNSRDVEDLKKTNFQNFLNS